MSQCTPTHSTTTIKKKINSRAHFFVFLAVLGIELMVSHMLGMPTTTWTTTPAKGSRF
jgi:hypothetical protein